jgi:HEAT repeat protein
MPIEMEDVVRSLIPDEADLNRAAATLGADALPHLESLVAGPDAMLASKATYVVSRIQDPRTIQILQIAARSRDRMVRLAAATVVQDLPPEAANAVLTTVLNDSDPEIRKIAVESVPSSTTSDVYDSLERLASSDPLPFIRDLSTAVLQRTSQTPAE